MVGAILISALAAAAWTSPSPEAVCARGGPDGDGDGLTDACELALLQRFAPVFVASPRACNWAAESDRLEGGYLVGAAPIPGGVRLAYLPAYFEDCGWSGAKCLLRLRGGCDPHAGDSEAVFIDLSGSAEEDDWTPRRIFLSAHCFGRSDGRCHWYEPRELTWFGGTAVIWVAEGKNANYPSRSACDSGHWAFDTCDRNETTFRFPVLSQRQNIGSASHPFPHAGGTGCVDARGLPTVSARPGSECVWSDERFGGWSRAGARGATGYRRYLAEIAGFISRDRDGV